MATLYGKLDRVKQYTTSTGTGTVSLNGAAFGALQTWVNGGAVSGVQYQYLIEEGQDSEWGFGVFTSGSPNTFSRDTVIGSIIGGTSGSTKMNLGGSATICCIDSKFSGLLVNYDAVILAESSLTHYWKLNEAAGATSFADSKGSTALTITSDTAGNIAAGYKGTINDGQSAVLFRGIAAAKNGNGNIVIPSGVGPSSGSWSLEMIIGFDGWYGAVIGVPLCIDNNGSAGTLLFYNRNDAFDRKDALWFSMAGGVDNWQPDTRLRIGRGTHIVVTIDSVANKCTIYNNGVKCPTQFTGTVYQQASNGGLGTYIPSRDAGIYPFAGKISKFAIYNTALSEATCLAHADAAGLA